jgi:hypothetical protein
MAHVITDIKRGTREPRPRDHSPILHMNTCQAHVHPKCPRITVDDHVYQVCDLCAKIINDRANAALASGKPNGNLPPGVARLKKAVQGVTGMVRISKSMGDVNLIVPKVNKRRVVV